MLDVLLYSQFSGKLPKLYIGILLDLLQFSHFLTKQIEVSSEVATNHPHRQQYYSTCLQTHS